MEQRGLQDMGGMFPRPGKALKLLLGAVAILTTLAAIVVNWAPGGAAGMQLFLLVGKCSRDGLTGELPRVWTLLTAGLFTHPTGEGAVSALFYALLGLYFFSPDLEKRWGPKRFLRFVAVSIVAGFLLGFVVDLIAPPHLAIFHPGGMSGPSAAITATMVAWSRQNQNAQVRLFFVLPLKGSWFFWLAVGYAVLGVVYWDAQHDTGVVAPFGGIMTGLLLGGSPSVVRTLYLRAKLAVLRKHSAAPPDRPSSPRPSRSSRQGGPPLRVVYGGLEDELEKRKPPKDKRYLN